VRKADNLPPSCAVVTKSGNFNFLEPSGPLQACNGTALPFCIVSSKGNPLFSPGIINRMCVTVRHVPFCAILYNFVQFCTISSGLFKHYFNHMASFVNIIIIIIMPSEENEVVSDINFTASCFRLAFLPFLLYGRVSAFLCFHFGS